MNARWDVAIVGGGPAGCALAIRLARSGRSVVVLERAMQPVWRAGGVFSSPATMTGLRALGVAEPTLVRVARAIPAMRVEASGRARFSLTYGDDGTLRAPAVGFDRPGLDAALVEMTVASGVEFRPRRIVTAVDVDRGRLVARGPGGEERVEARVLVGADGIRSFLARSVGVARPTRLGDRVGLTFHVADDGGGVPRDARMVVLDGAYCGLAPVPGGRVNVGIVLWSRSWRRFLAGHGAMAAARRVLEAIPAAPDEDRRWADRTRCDEIVGAAPLAHRVVRRAGPRWLLVGDAAGFLDPFTGEGLHRGLVSAELAAAAIRAHLDRGSPLSAYDQAMSRRFRAKDLATLLVQAFLAHPRLFDYAARRLAAREHVRETMGLVMGDLVPASRALDPRFLASLLRP